MWQLHLRDPILSAVISGAPVAQARPQKEALSWISTTRPVPSSKRARFRKLVAHLRERTDVQNLDLMNLAGFCRNCLSRWYRESAEERGSKLPDPEARQAVYGMPYDEWKKKYQTEPTKAVDHKH